jgi:hypothetical protein
VNPAVINAGCVSIAIAPTSVKSQRIQYFIADRHEQPVCRSRSSWLAPVMRLAGGLLFTGSRHFGLFAARPATATARSHHTGGELTSMVVQKAGTRNVGRLDPDLLADHT